MIDINIGQESSGNNETTMTHLAVHPFRIDVPQEALDDLRRRIAATRWPEKEIVPNRSQGLQLAKLQELVQYWGTDYDWRTVEARLNALPLIITHGWPGSVIEQLNVIAPLTDPTAHGGSVADAFDLVIPSIPGFGFSGKPTGTGWDPDRIARA
jgi:pimeloyl-ACP methyl ester carboxylesterase